jgi:hypothetical protein
MSAESNIIIGNLKKHIRELISKYEIISSDNSALKEELLAVKKELETKNIKIKELEEEKERILLAEAFRASHGDVKEAKKTISKIVKEIDKCISMLND